MHKSAASSTDRSEPLPKHSRGSRHTSHAPHADEPDVSQAVGHVQQTPLTSHSYAGGDSITFLSLCEQVSMMANYVCSFSSTCPHVLLSVKKWRHQPDNPPHSLPLSAALAASPGLLLLLYMCLHPANAVMPLGKGCIWVCKAVSVACAGHTKLTNAQTQSCACVE